VTIGKECSEVLEFVPAQLKVLVYEREKIACAACGDGGVSVAPTPNKVFEKGTVGPSLLAQIVVSKHNDHLPLYRQREIFKRDGVDLPRATMGRWSAMGAELVKPVADLIRGRVIAAFVMQTDDTHLRVLDRDHPNGVVRGAVWAYIGDGRLASFDYTPSRVEEGPLAYLAERRGYVQADAYTGYNKLFEGDDPPCIEVGCMAHTRRYFFDALAGGDPRAAWPLSQIAKLYEIEREGKELEPEIRAKLRQKRAGPLLADLGDWIHETIGSEPPKSPLGAALVYSRNQWKALNRYLEDGRLDIDNTRVERLMRMVAVGRKNYLFAGSDAAAHRACTHYTLICSARLSEIDPRAYLTDLYQKLADGWPQRKLDELLPAAWGESHPEALIATRPA
jgi:transposase